jgi:hypothetical protein
MSPRFNEKIYKVIMVEDGSTISTGFANPITAAWCIRNHKDYGVLDRKDWKVVRDYEAEAERQSKKVSA